MKNLSFAVLLTLPLINLVWGHDGEPGKWVLSAYTDDQSCANVVSVELDGSRSCDPSPSCSPDTTDAGAFHMGVKDGCVTDIAGYLKTAFKEAPYFMLVRTDSDYCSDNASTSSVLAFLADGKCHPYEKSGNFRVEKDSEGTVSLLLTSSGCDSKSWSKQLVTKSSDIGTGNCTEFGKAYLVNDNSSTTSATTASGKSGTSAVLSSAVALATTMLAIYGMIAL